MGNTKFLILLIILLSAILASCVSSPRKELPPPTAEPPPNPPNVNSPPDPNIRQTEQTTNYAPQNTSGISVSFLLRILPLVFFVISSAITIAVLIIIITILYRKRVQRNRSRVSAPSNRVSRVSVIVLPPRSSNKLESQSQLKSNRPK